MAPVSRVAMRVVQGRVPCIGLLCLLLSCPLFAEEDSPLRDHPSPYLALHADDPVAWRDWHPGLLAEARRDGLLLFISSGYFACHWCHVMQRESFQDAEIAALLNRFTLPVKLDRELHPALDAQLLEFVRRTRGHAGWPLNVFLTPDGHPLLGLVYAPPEEFRLLARNLEDTWREEGDELGRLARAAAHEMREQRDQARAAPLQGTQLYAAFETAVWERADDFEGGFGDQARFPLVPQLRVLLDRQAARPDARRATFLRLTLRQMARLGLRDQLGGGFFRYTTDPGWREPHFEKMLYDNAQLLGLYARAARVLEDPAWLEVAEHTFDFLYATMRVGNGGYISSLSALDGTGEEGGYYLWSERELARLLDDELRTLAGHWYGLRGNAPFAAGHLPLRQDEEAAVRAATGLDGAALARALAELDRILLAARGQRGLPRDDKQLAAWNGLLLQALVELARASGRESHHAAAGELRDFLVRELVVDGQVYRMRKGADYALPGELEDYAQLAAGLLDWAELTDSAQDRALARNLVEQAWERFYGDAGWLSGEAALALPAWQDALEDGPLPSSAATLLAVSQRLTVDAAGVARALERAAPYVAADPFAFASHVPLLGEPPGQGDQPAR